MTKPKKTPEDVEIERGLLELDDETVLVWSTVGVVLPISTNPKATISFSFGHARRAKNSTDTEIRKTAMRVDEFNEHELERRIAKYVRLVRTGSKGEIKGGSAKSTKGGRERALKRMGVK